MQASRIKVGLWLYSVHSFIIIRIEWAISTVCTPFASCSNTLLKWWKSPSGTPFGLSLLRTQEALPSCEVAVHMSICFAHHQTFAADRAQHSVQRAAVDPVDPAALRPKGNGLQDMEKQDSKRVFVTRNMTYMFSTSIETDMFIISNRSNQSNKSWFWVCVIWFPCRSGSGKLTRHCCTNTAHKKGFHTATSNYIKCIYVFTNVIQILII